MSYTSVGVHLSNTGDSIIQVEIAAANFNLYVGASSIQKVNLAVGYTYNIKLTQGRIVKNTKYVRLPDNTYGYNWQNSIS